MRYLKRIILLAPLVCVGEDFISHYEYGQMLYSNPRGVSCAQCHGSNGEGTVIVKYKDRGEAKVLKGADIRDVSLKNMIKSLNAYHKVMPRYYLTNDEVTAIYDYLRVKNKKSLLK